MRCLSWIEAWSSGVLKSLMSTMATRWGGDGREGHTDTGQGGGSGSSLSTMIFVLDKAPYDTTEYIHKKQTNKRSASVNPVLILKITLC